MLQIHHQLHFRASAAQAAAAYADPAYHQMRAAALDAEEPNVQITGSPDTSFTAHSTFESSTQRIPDTYRRFLGSRATLTEMQTWTREESGQYRGTLEITISGLPAKVTAHSTLRDDSGGSLMEVHANLTVKIPLMGSTIEQAMEPYVSDVFDTEQRTMNEYLGSASRGSHES